MNSEHIHPCNQVFRGNLLCCNWYFPTKRWIRTWVGLLSRISSIPRFPSFFRIIKSKIEYDVHILQLSPQLSYGDTRQTWTLLKRCYINSCKIKILITRFRPPSFSLSISLPLFLCFSVPHLLSHRPISLTFSLSDPLSLSRSSLPFPF